MGIAEQHAVTFAAAMAAEGLKPFCCIYSTFMQRGLVVLSQPATPFFFVIAAGISAGIAVGRGGPLLFVLFIIE